MLAYLTVIIATTTTELHALSLPDALPIFLKTGSMAAMIGAAAPYIKVAGAENDQATPKFEPNSDTIKIGLIGCGGRGSGAAAQDRKSTRLNSSHRQIAYAVFCVKKKYILR